MSLTEDPFIILTRQSPQHFDNARLDLKLMMTAVITLTVLKYQSTKYMKSFKLKVWTVHQEIEKPAISNF